MMNRDPLSSSQAPPARPHAAHSELAVSTNGCPHPRPSPSPDTAHVQNPSHARHQQGGTTSSLQGPDTAQQPQQGTSGHPRFLALPPLLPVADTVASPPFLRTPCTSRCLHHSAGAHPGDSRSSPSSPSLNAHCDDSFQLREQTTSLAFPAVGCPLPASSFLLRRRTHPLRIPACRARLRAPSCHRRLDPHDDPHDGEGVACAVPCPVVYPQLRVAFRIISSAPR